MNQVSLVEQLKELVKAQNERLGHNAAEITELKAENTRLAGRVQKLENENNYLKSKVENRRVNVHELSSASTEKNGETTLSFLNGTDPSSDSSRGELYSTALSSPECKTSTATFDAQHRIIITLSSTPNSASKGAKKTLTRTESRKAKRKSCYELSPDISDKHVQALENCYGGKQKSNRAARIIQQHYRSWAMMKAYHRLRTQSEVRRTSIKKRRPTGKSSRSPGSSGELSPIASTSVPFNLSLDTSDTSLSDGKNNSPKLKHPEGVALLSATSPKEEFKAIQTDLNIDENFQPVLDRQVKVSVQHMSEDISSIEISKNLLNDSIGQQMIIDEVFQQIMSPRKDSLSCGSRLDGFRRVSQGKSTREATQKEATEKKKATEKKEATEKEVKSAKDHDANRTPEESTSVPNENSRKEKVEIEEEIQPTKEDVVCDEKPTDKEKLTDSDESLKAKDDAGKSRDSAEVFDAIDGHSYSWPALDTLICDDSISLGGSSLSPSSSIIQTFYEDKEKDMRIGINHFNRKPKTGINYLIETGVLEYDPECVSKFLREEPGISKQKIGEYLGEIRNPFSMDVLQSFVRSINIKGKEVDEALRYFQTFFRMPGEAQKIEKLVEEFSATYVEENPGKVSDNPDTILVLSFAIIMLNTDLHSPSVKRKMSKQDFTRNLRGTDDGEDLPSDILSDIYDRIKKKAFKTGPDNMDTVLKYEKQILGKVPWTTLALPHRQLRQVTPLYEIQVKRRKDKIHHRIVFLFNDMIVVTKERGQAGQKGVHFYSYKLSYPLCDIKFSLFNNNYYKYGIRLLNRSNSQILISFNAKREDLRKAFFTELRECIEETIIMESERINSEKSRQLTGKTFGKLEPDTLSMTIPRSRLQKGKKPADSLSLLNEPSILPENELAANKLLSSSLQDLTQADGAYFEEPIHKSNSVTSFDSAYVGSVSTESVWSHYQESTRSTPDFSPNVSPQHLRKKFGIFSSKRLKNPASRKMAKSTGSLEDIKILQKSVSGNPVEQRKSEFFVKPPIAT